MTHDHQLAPNVPTSGAHQFITQVRIDDPAAPFSAEFQGAITHSDGLYLISTVPACAVLLAETRPTEYAVVHFGVRDNEALSLALARLTEVFPHDVPPARFTVAVTSRRDSFGAILEAAEAGGCGCGGKSDKPRGRTATITLRFEGEHGRTCTSDPLDGVAYPTRPRPGPVPTADAFALFDCHSVWHGFPLLDKWTECKGGCTSPETCICDGSFFGPKRTACDGWDTCWCD